MLVPFFFAVVSSHSDANYSLRQLSYSEGSFVRARVVLPCRRVHLSGALTRVIFQALPKGQPKLIFGVLTRFVDALKYILFYVHFPYMLLALLAVFLRTCLNKLCKQCAVVTYGFVINVICGRELRRSFTATRTS